uniref:Retrovirus-related Pol polyprotein from transposon TNT 1-94 n=1 Tax=Tanacetum cinerariifolium TaxID=118510 RepID=A0A6L2JA18_TANCI|nr:retrovirus-related Pol polyprotein from transposon TNT 1-94 [Tanacetum cinerariifolium]
MKFLGLDPRTHHPIEQHHNVDPTLKIENGESTSSHNTFNNHKMKEEKNEILLDKTPTIEDIGYMMMSHDHQLESCTTSFELEFPQTWIDSPGFQWDAFNDQGLNYGLGLTEFQCTAITKVSLLYAVTTSNIPDQSILTSNTASSKIKWKMGWLSYTSSEQNISLPRHWDEKDLSSYHQAWNENFVVQKKYDDDVEPESGEGLVARGRSSDRSRKYCKKLDHTVSDCYKLKNKLERESKRNNEKNPEKAAEVAIAKGDSDVYLAIDTEKFRDELIVEFDCTFHMIPHRSWFTTYESFNGGNVYTKNHSICLVIGKDLKRNLISLSTLEANGCKYSGGGGVMKIFKGALVLMKAIQSGGLCVLQGTVVYGTTGVSTSKASLDNFKLWHFRLGHMGEKGMKNLPKKGLIKVSCNLEFCEHCVFGKQKRVSFSPGIHRTRDALDYIHSDLWRPSPVTSRGGNSVDYYNLRVFGCPVYVHVNERKLVPCAVKCIFLGYGTGVKGYRVWCPDLKYRKIIHSRDVTFNEDVIINFGKDFVPPHNVDNNHTEGKVEFEFDVENSTHTQPPFNDEHTETQNDGNMPTSPQSQPQTEYLFAWDRERRQVNRPPILEDYQCDLVAYAFATAAYIKNCEPTNYLEEISSLECDKWVVAMEEEVESLHKNEM